MNILIFGPNGSGKGTQGAILQKKFEITHVESGGIFRENIKKETELGKKAKSYIDNGDLVPDEITIPMILDRLKQDDCKKGWLLDGFPRNPEQGKVLNEALQEAKIELDYVIELKLDRKIAKNRLIGRRLCSENPNHPNNIFIDGIKPEDDKICRVCGGTLSVRADDQDELAIDKRHEIYYDKETGTMASVKYFENLSEKNNGKPIFVKLDAEPGVKEVTDNLLLKLK